MPREIKDTWNQRNSNNNGRRQPRASFSQALCTHQIVYSLSCRGHSSKALKILVTCNCTYLFLQKKKLWLNWIGNTALSYFCVCARSCKCTSINNRGSETKGYSLVNHSTISVALLILITWQLTGVHFTCVGMMRFHFSPFWPCFSINIVLVSMGVEWQTEGEECWAGPGAAARARIKGRATNTQSS